MRTLHLIGLQGDRETLLQTTMHLLNRRIGLIVEADKPGRALSEIAQIASTMTLAMKTGLSDIAGALSQQKMVVYVPLMDEELRQALVETLPEAEIDLFTVETSPETSPEKAADRILRHIQVSCTDPEQEASTATPTTPEKNTP